MSYSTPGRNNLGDSAEAAFPDLVDQQFQDEHAPPWHSSQASGPSYGTSQQYPPEPISESEGHNIQAFAKIEFGDIEFYMNTYALELGRDIEAARDVEEREAEIGTNSGSTSRRRANSRSGSIQSDSGRQENDQNSVDDLVSENGGTVADHQRPEGGKKKRKKPKSWASSSRPISRTSSTQFQNSRTDNNALASVSLRNMSVSHSRPNFGGPLPSPFVCPLLPIHPPSVQGEVVTSHKSISRRHIRIEFNFDQRFFQIVMLGRNGAFVDEEWYAKGEIVPLLSGSLIQISTVLFRFVLPNVPIGETGAETESGSESLLSNEMEDFDMADSSRAASEATPHGGNKDTTSKDKQEDAGKGTQTRKRSKGKKKEAAPAPVSPKRKGPGRPPKNGVISKREQALIVKQAKQAEQEAKAKSDGRVSALTQSMQHENRNSPNRAKGEENNVQPNGKRKYTKRKRARGKEDQQAVRESTEHTESVPPEQANAATATPKPAKEKRPPKPPRSPSPVFDESQLTPEQLAKPQSSYVVLIHEALTNSKTGQMSLPQIYRAIERRYPFFKLRVQTQGWQSSVRHNLSQHPAFRKIERDGKGWMWGLVPEISIEKEKKRRATPPPATQQHYYPSNPLLQHPYPYPNMPQLNGNMSPAHYGAYPGMQPNRMPYSPAARPPFPLPIVNAVQSESTYRSPYQTDPPPATESAEQPQQPLSPKDINSRQVMPTSNLQLYNSSSNPNGTCADASSSPHPNTTSNTTNPIPNGPAREPPTTENASNAAVNVTSGHFSGMKVDDRTTNGSPTDKVPNGTVVNGSISPSANEQNPVQVQMNGTVQLLLNGKENTAAHSNQLHAK